MKFSKGDIVDIGGYLEEGQARRTRPYEITEEPVGDYAKVIALDAYGHPYDDVHTVYMGRWFTPHQGRLKS